MSRISWNDFTNKRFKAGLDRGVFYPGFGANGQPWDGLVSVDETTSKGLTPFFYEGIPYMVHKSHGSYTAKVSAYTYPDILLAYEGLVKPNAFAAGVRVDSQRDPGRFHMTYRTKVGNGDGHTNGDYEIHLCYNLSLVPDSQTHRTIGEQVDPNLFSWNIFGGKMNLGTLAAPSSHFVISSRELAPAKLLAFENFIYGTSSSNPRMPTISELSFILAA